MKMLSLAFASFFIALNVNATAKSAVICGQKISPEMLNQSYNAEPSELKFVIKDMKRTNPQIKRFEICPTRVDRDLKSNLVAVMGYDKADKLVALQQFYYLTY